MKRAIFILTLGAALAAAAYAGMCFAASAPARAELCAPDPELAWLKSHFQLDDAQFERVAALHNAFLPQCAERCREIASRNAALSARMAKTGQLTGDMEREMNEIAQLRADCQKESLRHFLAVSRLMPPAQGQRYLAWALEQTLACQASATIPACHSAMTH